MLGRRLDLAVVVVGGIHFVAIEEAVVLVAQVAGFLRIGDRLGQAGAEAVGARHDDAFGNTQFKEGIADRADLLVEFLMRHGDLAVLVAALLFVRHLVLDLQRAGTGFDHLLGEEVCRLGIAETGVDIGDDWDDMRFVLVDFLDQALRIDRVIGFLRRVQFAKQAAQFAGIRLVEEGVEFLDQVGDAGLFVHRLIGQRTEFAAQRGNHPA